MWWVFDYPATSHWAVVSVGLVPRLASPHLSSVRRVTTSRTTSTLHDLSPPLLSRVLVTQTGVVELRRSLAGKVGVSPFPIVD